MIDACRAELDGQSHTGPETELVAVHAGQEPAAASGLKDPPGLLFVERARIAEDVDPPRVRRARRRASDRDQLDVCGSVARVLGRHDVRTQERGLGGDLAGDRQQPRLVFHGEPVAALDLDSGRAERAHLGQAGPRCDAELVGRSERASRQRWSRCRRRCTALRPCARRTPPSAPPRRRGGCGCPRSRGPQHDPRRRRARRSPGPGGAGPPRRRSRPRRATAASWRMPSGDPSPSAGRS